MKARHAVDDKLRHIMIKREGATSEMKEPISDMIAKGQMDWAQDAIKLTNRYVKTSMNPHVSTINILRSSNSKVESIPEIVTCNNFNRNNKIRNSKNRTINKFWINRGGQYEKAKMANMDIDLASKTHHFPKHI